MKKFILAIALVASVASTFVSCSADDSDLQNSSSVQGIGQISQGEPVITPPLKPKP